MLKLFISHSARKSDGSADAQAGHDYTFLNACYEAIRKYYGGKLKVLADKQDINPGERWEDKIHDWLYECHVALILVSPAALQSDWVKKEAAILAWRGTREKNLKIIPILLDVKPEEINAGFFAASGLLDYQAARNFTCDEILACVRHRLGEPDSLPSIHATSYDELLCLVSELVSEAPSQTSARGIASGLLRDGQQALKHFESTLDTVTPKPSAQRARELLKRIRSLWVLPGAAAMLPEAIQHDALLALNGEMVAHSDPNPDLNDFTIQRFVERAWPNTYRTKLIHVSNLDGIESIRDEIRRRFSPGKPEAQLHRCDKAIRESEKKIVVLLQPSQGEIPDPYLIRELQMLKKGWGNVVFIVFSGSTSPENPQSGVRCIRPPVDLDQESDRYDDECSCWETIENIYGARR